MMYGRTKQWERMDSELQMWVQIEREVVGLDYRQA
jgi:hypothetical protein